MLPNRLAFAGLAAACIVAAGVGGYLASRPSTPAPATAAAAPAVAAPAAAPVAIPDRPVQETEAVVGDTAPKAAPAAPLPAPVVKRGEQPSHEAASRGSAARPTKSANAAKSEPLPTLDRTWPSGAATPTPSSPAQASTPATAVPEPTAPRTEDHATQESPRAPEPARKTFDELVVPAESVIGLQIETPLSSERARVEDRVEARVTRDVRVNDKVAIPSGARAVGSVTQVERGGKFKEQARLGIRFHTLVLADGTRLPVNTETIMRYGAAPGNESAAKIGGGAVGGAILGAILGGAKGAVIGATTGAGAGTAVVAAGDRNAATVRSGEQITARLLAPVTVTVEQK